VLEHHEGLIRAQASLIRNLWSSIGYWLESVVARGLMDNQLFPEGAQSGDQYLARLYRLQVRELEDYAFFLSDLNGQIITWNKGVEVSFGYKEDEFIGQNVGLIFTEEDRAARVPETEMTTAAKNGRSVDIRWHRRKDGSRAFMTGVLKALHGENGEMIGYSKICLDDTARKHLEDALTQSNADLQQFAFVASHDLQEPLRTIISFGQLLQRRHDGALDEDAIELLRTMLNAGQRMNALIQDLLGYSQLSKEENAVSVHLDEDLEAAITLLQSSILDSGAIITHDPLPVVRVDRGQVVRLFQNLIGNALKFRKRDELPRIHISAELQGNEWIIRVQDNGIGFASEYSNHIFAPFKRLHGKEYAGSGIRLATCRRIVEGFGGKIGAESNPGAGASFWFTIPAEKTIDRLGNEESRAPTD
jgi:PAS domain S-box-containing protein